MFLIIGFCAGCLGAVGISKLMQHGEYVAAVVTCIGWTILAALAVFGGRFQ